MPYLPVLINETLLTKNQFDSRTQAEERRRRSSLMPEEVMGLADTFRTTTNKMREIVLTIYEAKGWFALDYETFELFGKRELKLNRSRLYEILNGAEVDRQLKKSGKYGLLINGPLPDRLVRILVKIKSNKNAGIERDEEEIAELRREAYKSAKDIAETITYKSFDGRPNPHNNKVTGPILEQEVRSIMQREGMLEIATDIDKEHISDIVSKVYNYCRVGKTVFATVMTEDSKEVNISMSVAELKLLLNYKL